MPFEINMHANTLTGSAATGKVETPGAGEAYPSHDERRIVSRHLDSATVAFDLDAAHKFLKIRKSSPNIDTLDAILRDSVRLCRDAIVPSYQYAICRIDQIDSASAGVVLDNGIRFDSPGLARVLGGAQSAAFFVLTLGEKVDLLIEKWTIEDFTRAYVLDGVASALVHGVLEILEGELSALANEKGLALSRRFCPGFHRWDLRQQKQMFEILDPGEIGMDLSEAYFMLPQHSISGVYGLVPSAAK